MNKTAAIAVSVGLIVAGVAVTKVVNAKTAAEKLELDFDSLKVKEIIKSGFLPTGVVLRVRFKLTNPTNTTLRFTKPFVKISLKDKNGNLQKITQADPEKTVQKVPGKGSSLLDIDLPVKAASVLTSFPDLIPYVWGRMNGEKSTRKAQVDYSFDSLDLTISDKMEVNL